MTSCSTAAGRWMSQAASATELRCSVRSSRASLAAAVVLPEPCRPAIRITVGGREANVMPGPRSPPIIASSSSWTILTTCWPGLSWPMHLGAEAALAHRCR